MGAMLSSASVSSPVNSTTPLGTDTPEQVKVSTAGSPTVQTTAPARLMTSVLPTSLVPVMLTFVAETKSEGGMSN